MPRIVKKHPLALRWFHWINFPILAVMIWSGTLILWANDTYATQLWQSGYRILHSGKDDENPPKWLRVPDSVVVKPDLRVIYNGDTLPENYPDAETRTELKIGRRLAEGMAWHFLLAWFFALNGLAYVIFLLVSGQWRHLVPQKNSFVEATKVAIKDLAFWKKLEPAPDGEKYNHAQRIAYSSVSVLGALMLVTGLAISKPAQLAWLSAPFGGYQGARLVHFIVTCLFVVFFFVHVSQVVRAGWNNFRAMVTGWEQLPDSPEPMETIVPEKTLIEEEEEIVDELQATTTEQPADTRANPEGA